MRRKVATSVIIGMAAAGLSGCGATGDINTLNNMQALNSESTVDSYNVSMTDKEEAVYAQVVARQLLDLSTLETCNDNEKEQVIQFMNTLDGQLTGTIPELDGVVGSEFTDYILMEFAKTPYYWQRSETNIRGIDGESRSIIVDVTYKTLDYTKDILGSSYIAKGEDDYEQKLDVRFKRWQGILNEKYTAYRTDWETSQKEFEKVYGKVTDILESQKSGSLTDTVYGTGNQVTYNGLVDSVSEEGHGSITIRYCLTPKYVLGINTGMECNHLYKIDYSVSEDPTEGLDLFKDEGYATITDNIYDLVYSYFTCIDESDYTGLYKLTKDFSMLDKYYEEYFNTTYRKHEGFTVSLFDISGTKVKCGVSISSKVRAKGSNSTYPVYTDRYYIELNLVDDTLKVSDMVLLSSTLEGEPAISTRTADTSGFLSSIELENADKQEIEESIAEFGALQLSKDTSSDKFGEIVDTSMSQKQLTSLKSTMTSLSGEKKVTWLVNYQQGTSSYASVRCRELYQAKDGGIQEADVTYSLIKKGTAWYVYSYDVNSNVKLDTENLVTAGSLAIVKAGEVETLTSQVVNTSGSSVEGLQGNTGTIYTHDTYTPKSKTGSQQKLAKMTVDKISTSQMESVYTRLMEEVSSETTYNTYSELSESLEVEEKGSEVNQVLKELNTYYYNVVGNRYEGTEQKEAKEKVELKITSLLEGIETENEELKETITSWKEAIK